MYLLSINLTEIDHHPCYDFVRYPLLMASNYKIARSKFSLEIVIARFNSHIYFTEI